MQLPTTGGHWRLDVLALSCPHVFLEITDCHLLWLWFATQLILRRLNPLSVLSLKGFDVLPRWLRTCWTSLLAYARLLNLLGDGLDPLRYRFVIVHWDSRCMSCGATARIPTFIDNRGSLVIRQHLRVLSLVLLHRWMKHSFPQFGIPSWFRSRSREVMSGALRSSRYWCDLSWALRWAVTVLVVLYSWLFLLAHRRTPSRRLIAVLGPRVVPTSSRVITSTDVRTSEIRRVSRSCFRFDLSFLIKGFEHLLLLLIRLLFRFLIPFKMELGEMSNLTKSSIRRERHSILSLFEAADDCSFSWVV